MSRTVFLALVLLSAVLVVLPISLTKPGFPATLRADEPAYVLAAESLVHDRDLRCDDKDLQRLFDEYPYLTVNNLILASPDGWRTLYFGKPFVYSLFAAPFVALWGSRGMVAFNMVLVAAILWMGVLHLRRFNDDTTSALFATGFVLWSTTLSYAFWLHPELFMMAGTAACLFFGLDIAAREQVVTAAAGRWPSTLAPALSGASLALAAYHKPVLALIGLPVVVALLRLRHWRRIMMWMGGATAAGILAIAGSYLLIGQPTAYLGLDRSGFTVTDPYHPPITPRETSNDVAGVDGAGSREGGAREGDTTVDSEETEPRAADWWWLFRPPDIEPQELAEDLSYFFLGRHTGLLVYQPIAAICLLLFVLYARRSAARWTLVLSLVAIAGFFLILIPFNWHGGGGFVGNRYFVMVYPAFLFLVTRVGPSWITVASWLVGSALLGPMVIAPLGGLVSQPTLQAHARNKPFQPFLYELSLRELPGHQGIVFDNAYFLGRKDQTRPINGELWMQGADTVEVWVQATEPQDMWVFDLRTAALTNTVTIALGNDRKTVELEHGKPLRVILRPDAPDRIRHDWDIYYTERRDVFAYRLTVTSATGEIPRWRWENPHTFYLGTAVTYRGSDPDAASPGPPVTNH